MAVKLKAARFDKLVRERVGFLAALAKHLGVTCNGVRAMRAEGYGMTRKGQRRIKAVNEYMGRVK